MTGSESRVSSHKKRAFSVRQRLSSLARSKFVRDTAILQVGTAVNIGATLLTSIIVFRGLEPEGYGIYKLAVALYGMLTTLDLTGLGPATSVRLAAALARADREAALDLIAFYIKVSAWVAIIGLALAFALGPAVATWFYGASTVGELARGLALLLALDPVHQLVALALQSARQMARFTTMNALLALADLGVIGAAVLGGHGPGGVIAARLAASALIGGFAVAYYALTRARLHPALPGWRAILSRVFGAPVRPYLGFGFGIALDKNVATLFTLLPLQLLGRLHGEAAAGYLSLAQSAISMPSAAFNAVMSNLGVRLPQDVGRGDHAALRRNYARVTKALAAGSVAIFGLFALIAPWLVPFLYGEEATPAAPLIGVLAVYGAIAAAGGSMGALYRALERVNRALCAKLVALAIMAAPGYWLIREYAALGAAWTITAALALSVALTAALVLPYLRRLAAGD